MTPFFYNRLIYTFYMFKSVKIYSKNEMLKFFLVLVSQKSYSLKKRELKIYAYFWSAFVHKGKQKQNIKIFFRYEIMGPFII